MVRDPVERVISWYYYVRAPWYFVERKRAFPDLPLPNPNWLRKVKYKYENMKMIGLLRCEVTYFGVGTICNLHDRNVHMSWTFLKDYQNR